MASITGVEIFNSNAADLVKPPIPINWAGELACGSIQTETWSPGSAVTLVELVATVRMPYVAPGQVIFQVYNGIELIADFSFVTSGDGIDSRRMVENFGGNTIAVPIAGLTFYYGGFGGSNINFQVVAYLT